jgi:3-deoxy-D-manno-octulosonic-acid transferase
MAEQLREAGSPAATYCGDLKHARGTDSQLTQASLERLREALAFRPDGPLWLAASTHDGEEAAVLSAHAALRSGAHPNLLLLLVPRHPERGADVAAAAAAAGLEVARRRAGHHVGPTTAVYVCDTLGELPALYALAPIAFVGGSLVPLGGHNVLEPAQAPGGCAVLHGPYVEATAEAVAALGATEPPAAQCVRSAEELHARLDEALRDVSSVSSVSSARPSSVSSVSSARPSSVSSVSSVSSLAARRAAASRAARALEEGVSERVWGALEGPLGLPRGGHGERTGEARPAVPLNITET